MAEPKDDGIWLVLMLLREGLQDAIANREEDRIKQLSTAIGALSGTSPETEVEATKKLMRANDDGPVYE